MGTDSNPHYSDEKVSTEITTADVYRLVSELRKEIEGLREITRGLYKRLGHTENAVQKARDDIDLLKLF